MSKIFEVGICGHLTLEELFPYPIMAWIPRLQKPIQHSSTHFDPSLIAFAFFHYTYTPLPLDSSNSKLKTLELNKDQLWVLYTPWIHLLFLSIFLITSRHATLASYLCLVFIDTNKNTYLFIYLMNLIHTQTHATTYISRYTSG